MRAAAEQAHLAWDAQPPVGSGLPYLPDCRPSERRELTGPAAGVGGWAWGITTAVGIADTVAELVRAILAISDGVELDEIKEACRRVSAARTKLLTIRKDQDTAWERADVPPGGPDVTSWQGRLHGVHEQAMGDEGTQTGALVTEIMTALAGLAATVRWVASDPRFADDLGLWTPLVYPQPDGPVGASVLLMRLLALGSSPRRSRTTLRAVRPSPLTWCSSACRRARASPR